MTGRSSLLPFAGRLASAGAALACLALLVIASRVTPDAAGHGTHAQLGLPACGWVVMFGKPCFSCGMTTAFAHAVRLDLGPAFLAQPLGMMLALAGSGLFWIGLYSAATGSRLILVAADLFRPRPLMVLAAIGLLSWAYKWITWST